MLNEVSVVTFDLRAGTELSRVSRARSALLLH